MGLLRIEREDREIREDVLQDDDEERGSGILVVRMASIVVVD